MFEIRKEEFGNFDKYILSNKNTNEYISIIPSFGANINSVVLIHNNQLFSIIDGDETYESLMKNRWSKGAKLVPFVNRIKDGKYSFEGNDYQLFPNQSGEGHAIHGLIFDKVFTVIDLIENEDRAVINLEYNYKHEVEGYPFCFCITLSITLDTKGLHYSTTVKNTGESNMPFGDGWHPYFKFDEAVEELSLLLPKSRRIVVDSRMIPTGEMLDYNNFVKMTRIGDTALDTGFQIHETDKEAISKIYSQSKKVCINLRQDIGINKYNFLQVFIPPSRTSIALEPMTSSTDAFNNKQGLICLKPEEVYQASYSIFLS